jgi:translation initiation factor 1A
MGKKKSKLSSKVSYDENDIMLPDDEHILGKVERLVGGDRLLVSLPDGRERTVRIPGKFRGQVLFRPNSYVLLREVMPGSDETLDVVYRYSWEEADYLKEQGLLEEW